MVREASTRASSWRSSGELHRYLDEHGVVGITEVDTRALTRHLRDHGAKRGVISPAVDDTDALVRKARASRNMVGLDLAREVTCAAARTTWTRAATGPFKVVAYDFGMKRNIGRMLAAAGCDVTVVPATTSGQDALALKPDGVFLSNGPGDPEPLDYAIDASKRIMEAQVPLFGICLGHQILGLACGAKTFKLKFGHRGANHPVKNLRTGQVEITSQNHGFSVDPAAFERPGADPHPREPERRHGGGIPPPRPARGLRAVPSRGQPRSARQPLPVRRLREAHVGASPARLTGGA